MIEIQGIHKKFGRKEVLHDISMQLEKRIYGLLGPNGAGKTTLIRILAGVYRDGELSKKLRDLKVGYLPQKFGCFPELTVYEQLEYFCCIKEIRGKEHEKEIARVMELANITTLAKEKCCKLSGGMVRRVGIAQALLGKTELLLLDEPTVGLDMEERNQFIQIIRQLDGKIAVILSTHIVEDVKYLCDNIFIMKDGNIVRRGSAQEIIKLVEDKVHLYEASVLDNIEGDYYVIRKEEMNGKSYVRVLELKDTLPVGEEACIPDITDAYFYVLKENV